MKSSDEELLEYKYHILKHTTDGEEGFNEYLDSLHLNIITEDSLILYSIMDDYISLFYMEALTRKGYRECRDFTVKLYNTYTLKQNMPIVYTGKTNIGKNNSIKIAPNTWQLKL